MSTVTNVLDTSRILNYSTSRVVKNIEGVGGQSMQITLNGLNINTHLNLYVDFRKVPASKIDLIDRPGQTFSTDFQGKADFVFYYTEDLTQLNNLPEAKYEEFLAKNTGKVLFVAVDKASIDTDELPENYKSIARCYAEQYVERTYGSTLNNVQDITINEIPG